MTGTQGSPEAVGLDPAIYNSFVADLELVGIEFLKVHGERVVVGVAAHTRFDLTATYQRDDRVIYYRYEATSHFVDDNNVVLGNVMASIQVVVRSKMTPSESCIEQFGATSGSLMAHPYLREAIASTAQRLDFLGVLLPMMKQHLAEPDEI